MYLYRNMLVKEIPLAQINRYMPAKLTTRTQMLFGRDDVVIDPEMIAADHSKYATDFAVEIVEGAGHFIIDEQPELVTAKLLEFFA
jgi:pimeloyl-ACP methyl ester carboxylesterase